VTARYPHLDTLAYDAAYVVDTGIYVGEAKVVTSTVDRAPEPKPTGRRPLDVTGFTVSTSRPPAGPVVELSPPSHRGGGTGPLPINAAPRMSRRDKRLARKRSRAAKRAAETRRQERNA
jgi:hypothetical protein